MFASTGDNGYACPEVASTGVPEGPPGVSWPADGEYTTAVGGTEVLANEEGDVQEEDRVGRRRRRRVAVESAPAMDAAGQPRRADLALTNQGGRGVPDVAADAAEVRAIWSTGETLLAPNPRGSAAPASRVR